MKNLLEISTSVGKRKMKTYYIKSMHTGSILEENMPLALAMSEAQSKALLNKGKKFAVYSSDNQHVRTF